MAYFKQEAVYPGTPVYLPNGHKISLDFVDNDLNGFLATDNGYLVNQIRTAIASRSGGWIEISQTEYDEAVKKKASQPLKRKGYRNLNAGMFQPNRNGAGADSVEVAVKPDPIMVPKPEEMKLPPRPRVGRMVTA